MNPLISVIVPVFGVEKYIYKCVNSIINQTYTNLEIILVNDGSPDKCPQICDDFARQDLRIKVIHKENGGQASARNMALDICNGEYISFVDSDDWIKEDMIQAMYEAAAESQVQLAICGLCTYNDISYTDHNHYDKQKLFTVKELIKEYISTPSIHTGPCNKLYFKDLFNNIRFPEVRAREDAFIMHQVLSRANSAVLIPDCKYIQYLRFNSTELSKFNYNKLFLLDCALELQTFIYSNFPDLYSFVRFKYANEIIVLMKDIVSSFSYKKYQKTYEDLNNKLISQLKVLIEFKNTNEYKKIDRIVKYNIFYRIYFIFEGIIKRFKQLLKNIYRKTRTHTIANIVNSTLTAKSYP